MRYLSVAFICLFILTSAAPRQNLTSAAHRQNLTPASQGQNLTSANEYSQRGMARFEKNDLDGAIADFTKAIEMNGQNQEYCYYFRGMAHYRKGNSDQAIIDLSKAIAIKPHPRFYDDRGNLLALQGELDRAIADLNKAIEIEPKYAKAYGDRGIVRLLRGENTVAEQDFKKCFELDSALESQFKTAANQVRQRAASRYEQQKPSDVEIVKFNWTEAPSLVLTGTASPSFPASSSTVSSSGTRVLADANAKGQPGPAEVVDPMGTGLPPSRLPDAGPRTVRNYKFTTSIRNTGSKTIVAIQWAYLFDAKDSAHEGLAYIFTSKTNIAPGKEKSLTDSVSSVGTPQGPKLPTKQSRGSFNERVAILRLDYADGSSWQSSGPPASPKKTQP